MNDIQTADVRNLVLLGHTASGKTSLIDALLFKLGVNDRRGSVDDGTSAADHTDEEKTRRITIHAKPFSAAARLASGKSLGLVCLDTPGYADFFGQVITATAVADAAMILVDATAGIQVGTTRVWRQCEALGLPRGILITGIDRENADFAATLAAVREAWGEHCAPVVLPGAEKGSVVNVLSGSTDLAGAAAAARDALIEIAAETDDTLIEKFLGGEGLSDQEMTRGLRTAVRQRRLVPGFAAAAPADVGLPELLEVVHLLFPSPLDREPVDAAGRAVDPRPEAPVTARVWRTVNDPYVGQLTFVRMYGGVLKPDADIVNVNRDEKERLSSILVVNGKKQDTVEAAGAGEIVALPKLKHTGLGDSLCAAGHAVRFPGIRFPSPVASFAVTAKSRGDEDKIGAALARVAEEDPTVRIERNAETKETVISGLGDVQIEVAVERMKQRNNVEVLLSTPKVAYKETVTATGEGHYKHKKQSGGRGQYGEVYLRVEPKPPEDEEWFVDGIVGGVIPGNFMPAVQKGVVDGMTHGAVARYPVTNVKVTVYDGSYHEVDSSEIAFKIAASRAFRDGMAQAKPVLLEPVMKITVLVAPQYMGDVNGDLSHRRGRILGMDSAEGMQQITAEVPLAELFRYAAELRSMTGGQGSFEMEFLRYDLVPANITQKIIAETEKARQEED